MEVLKLKEFNPDKLKAVISKKLRYGEREFTSVGFLTMVRMSPQLGSMDLLDNSTLIAMEKLLIPL